MRKLVIGVCIITAVFLYSNVHSAFKVYLKNGHTIVGVDAVERNDKIKIYKRGMILEMPRADVIKIEEYKTDLSSDKTLIEKTSSWEDLPEYLRHEEKEPLNKEKEEDDYIRELHQLKQQKLLLLRKTINILKQRGKELEFYIDQSVRFALLEKASRYTEEKAKIDKEIESLKIEEEKASQNKEQKEDDYRTEIHQLKRQNLSLLDRTIELLEHVSKGLRFNIHRKSESRQIKKVRMFREKKAKIDKEIESLRKEKDLLLKN